MTDWQVVEGHLSRASCSPGAQVMVRPHPRVLSLLRGHSRDKPTGVPRLPISMEMKRARGRSRLSLAPLWSAPPSLRGVRPRLHSHRTRAAGPTRTPTTPPTPTSHSLPLSFLFFLHCLLRNWCKHEGGQHVRPSLPWQRWPCEACWEQW